MDIYTNTILLTLVTLNWICISRYAKRVKALEEKSNADMIQLLDVAEQEYAALWRTIDRMQKDASK